MRIIDMTLGTQAADYYVLREVHTGTTRNGKQYLSAVLLDITGTISAKLWEYFEGMLIPPAGTVVFAEGLVEEYQNTPQLKLSILRGAPKEEYLKYCDIADLVPVAPIDVAREMDFILKTVNSMKNPVYRSISKELLNRHATEFSVTPAAKSIHHSFRSGLLMHTANMLLSAMNIALQYGLPMDCDLLFSGVILHDFGKISEFVVSDLGLVTDYSVKGKLKGHPTIGAEEVGRIGTELGIPEEEYTLLQHLILSHHGQAEHGAVVKPACLEAEILSYVDKMDSRMEVYHTALGKVNVGEFTDKIYVLDKQIYRHC